MRARAGGIRLGSWLAGGALVAIPAIVFTSAAILGGHLLLTGDNLIQNYPLRVLVGSSLRHGAEPGWNPYSFGGTPLAAGLNASAYFPTTLLFAVLPAQVAWVLGNVVIYASVGLGTFCLFRASGAAVLASFLGAGTFAFAGAATTQAAVHLDMANGIACLPWTLLAVRKIVDGGGWRWSLALGAAISLGVLAGSPEALLGTVAASLTYGILRWSAVRGRGWRTLSQALVAPIVALAATAFVWIPALDYIAYSQRAHVTEFAASGYSFPGNALVLAVIPYLEGGYHVVFSQLVYFGPSNSGEVTLYLGLLPVVAALLLASRRWSGRLPVGERRCWYGVLAVSLLLAVAAATPLEHILYHVPFYGHQRDSGRNIVEADLAASALFTWWVDGGTRKDWRSSRYELAVPALLVAVVAVAAVLLALSPSTLWQLLSAGPPRARPAGTWWALVLAGALALSAAAVCYSRRLVPRGRWQGLVAALTLVDVGLFSCGSLYFSAISPPSSDQPGPVLTAVARQLTAGGRYAVFDPGLFDPHELAEAGEPDTGILVGLPAVTGYGSLVDGQYADATVATSRDYLSPTGLASGLFDQLDLQVLVTLPESFLIPVSSLPSPLPPYILSESRHTDPALPAGTDVAPNLPGVPRTSAPRPALAEDRPQSWWFGTDVTVTAAFLQLGAPAGGERVRIGLIGDGGSVRWEQPQVLPAGATDARLPADGRAEGLEVQLLSGSPLSSLDVGVIAGAHSYLVDGVLADAVDPSNWHLAARVGDFVIYRSVTGARTVRVPAGTATVIDGSPTTGSGSTVAVKARAPSELVVSTAYDPGWRAEVSSGGTSRDVPVVRDGLVMAVAVPSGSSIVTLTFHPEGLASGVLLSLATIALLALVVALVVGRRLLVRRRWRESPPGTAGGGRRDRPREPPVAVVGGSSRRE